MSTPADDNRFSFPFQPYDIQLDFMSALYKALEDKKVGLFESPTGTGKSLSIICGCLTWLGEFKQRQLDQQRKRLEEVVDKISQIDLNDNDDWIKLHQEKVELSRERDQLKKVLEKHDVYVKKNEDLKERRGKMLAKSEVRREVKKLKTDAGDENVEEGEDDVIVNYDSEDEEEIAEDPEPEDDKIVRPKIIYCSRTHSQLTQFVNEIKRTVFAQTGRVLRLVVLGSRANLCVNESVAKLKSVNLINDRCRDFLRNKSKCPMHKQALMNQLKDEILSTVQDIEELAAAGRQAKACPYYGSRFAVSEAELVIVPYNLLFQSETRRSFGIDLTESIVIVDEAHNLCETINMINSVELKGQQVIDAHQQLTAYMTRYNKRLSPKNLMNIKQILFILSVLIKHLNSLKELTQVYDSAEFLMNLKIENMNLFKIVEYCEKSQIARKLFGFAIKASKQGTTKTDQQNIAAPKGTGAFLTKMKEMQVKGKKKPAAKTVVEENEPVEKQPPKAVGSPLYNILEFFRAIINPRADAKIIVNKDKESLANSSVKFLLLNSSAYFKDIVENCRSVILAGGTMKPFSEYSNLLFKPLGIDSDRIITFSCGHIIPKNNLLALALGAGPTNKTLSFTYQTRNSKDVVEETGRLLANVCNIIPGGVVCFLPSYEYEEQMYHQWIKFGIIKLIESKNRKVFREPKRASDVQSVLADYARTVRLAKNSGGALLLSIVGGKMSEGINFSDDLGRCVVMIGLPYANKSSPELQVKLKYLNSISEDAGQSFYENQCMKAVNQSIGRSIRHKQDFAVILLVDVRYTNRQEVQSALPDWIRSHLVIRDKFGPAFGDIRKFFVDK